MNDWWRAGAYVAAGIILGVIAAGVTRRLLDRPQRRQALRQAAKPTAALLFWLIVAAGLISAVASTSPETLDPIPSDILGWLPRVGVAGLILIAGYVLATVATAAVGRAASRATGRRQHVAETTTRLVVIGAAGVLALSQLGIDTTILNIVVAALAFGISAAIAGIAVLGGRHTASSVAAGRALADHLQLGDHARVGGHQGVIEQLTATHLILVDDDARRILVPFALTETHGITITPRTSDPSGGPGTAE